VTRGGVPVHLTPTEYQLLLAFVTNPGKLLTQRWLLSRVWGRATRRRPTSGSTWATSATSWRPTPATPG